MNKDYNILFHFENDELSIFEIKINNIDTTDKSKIYHWLLSEKINNELFPLHFKEMGKADGKEFRKFSDAYLEFDSETNVFIRNGKASHLQRISPDIELNQIQEKLLSDYMTALKIDK